MLVWESHSVESAGKLLNEDEMARCRLGKLRVKQIYTNSELVHSASDKHSDYLEMPC